MNTQASVSDKAEIEKKSSPTVPAVKYRCVIFFFIDTATTEIYTLSLHDALPICARNAEEVSRAADRLGGPGKVLGLRSDVGSVDDCAVLVPAVLEHFGRIDALVNNAGVYYPIPFLEFIADDWDALMNINVRGPV